MRGHRLSLDDDGRTVDRFGRDLAKVRAGVRAATILADHSARLSAAVEACVRSGDLELARIAGPRLIWRFAWNAGLLRSIADRDSEIAELLEQAAAEDAAATEEVDGR